jgi:hypothetical protein
MLDRILKILNTLFLMLSNKYLVMGLIAMTIGLSSCNDDDDNQTTDPAPEMIGTAEVKFDHVWGPSAAPFALNTALTHPATGEEITFTKLRYYISNVRFHKTNGETYIQPESYYIVDASSPEAHISIADIPAGSYTGISYYLGVDSTRNVSGAQTGALDPAEGMFWSWNSGYIFVKAEGQSPASPTSGFVYHIGGFAGVNSAIREMHHDFGSATLDVSPGAVPQVHLMVNAARFWHGGISLADMSNVHMPGANASMLATNFAGGFMFDHIHN